MSSDPQLSLAVEPRTLAHTEDVETSKTAASANLSIRLSHRHICLEAHEFLERRERMNGPGLTDDEVALFTGLDLIEARRRCSDLRNLGLIGWLTLDGVPVMRNTRLGCRARASAITHAGREALA